MNIFKRYFLFKALDSASKENAQNNITMAGFLNDHISLRIIIDGWFEKRELNALKSFFSQRRFSKALCLDIGANIGNHSLFFSTIFDKVIAFEPYDKTFDLLKINSSQAVNIQVNNFGFSDASKELPAQVVFGNIGATSIVSSVEQSNTILKLETLDAFANENSLQGISFIKIDVEGHEYSVLTGAEDTLRRENAVISLELEMTNYYENCIKSINFLKSCGYSEAHFLKNSFSGAISSNFKKSTIEDFLNLPRKRHKMVLFTK
jgi:FkbM family methyltransferase